MVSERRGFGAWKAVPGVAKVWTGSVGCDVGHCGMKEEPISGLAPSADVHALVRCGGTLAWPAQRLGSGAYRIKALELGR